MTIDKALKCFYSSPFASGRTIGGYAVYKDGYILIPKLSVIQVAEAVQYYVRSDGTVIPAHPMLFKFDRSTIKKVSN